jgi:hypothetical protein
MRAFKAFGYVLIMTSAPMLVRPAYADCSATQPDRTPTTRYVIRDGQVYDTRTKLTWQRCSLGETWEESGCAGAIDQMSWSDAMSRATDGWRLPTKDELATLVSPTCRNPAINEEVFPGMALDKLWYWSSTPYDDSTAWNVDFGHGSIYGCFRWFSNSVRLVRSNR